MVFNLNKIKEKTSLEWHLGNDLAWQGAVLFLFLDDQILLIKRSEEVPHYKGHLAFLGGHKRQSEDHPFDVARREFEEETSLSREHLEILGVLPPVFTKRATLIIPLLARLNLSQQSFREMVLSNGEWRILLGVPWWRLADEKMWRYGLTIGREGKKDTFLFRPIGPGDYSIYSVFTQNAIARSSHSTVPCLTEDFAEFFMLWGATAKMVWNFFKLYYS